MGREQAQKDMGAQARRQPMADRAEVQIDGLQAAKGALDVGEVLVGTNDPIGRQGGIRDTGADHIKPVEPGFGGDARGVAGKSEALCGDGDVEQLGELVAVLDAGSQRFSAISVLRLQDGFRLRPTFFWVTKNVQIHPRI
jgi:hypothetical protein